MRHKLREIDGMLGSTLKAFRKQKGFSQAELADGIGISSQQLQKYEKGVNRISASRLLDIATALSLDITDFYRNLKPGDIDRSASNRLLPVLQLTAEELELIRLYNEMANTVVKQAVIQLMKANI